jgi:low affinity Fe/Cu permease
MFGLVRKLLTAFGVLAARPVAFAVVVVYAAFWATLSPETLGWQGIVALSTWMMTVIIQRAEHRDTQAIHAKLDHLLSVVEKADPKLAAVDKLQPEEIERLREDAHVSGGRSR